jgi:putative transposase
LICGFIDTMRAEGYGVELGRRRSRRFCQVLRSQGLAVAPRSDRNWRAATPAARALSDAAIAGALRRLQALGPNGRPSPEVLYGRRKMTAFLDRHGFPGISKHTVDRLMRDEGMNGLVRGRTTRTTIPAKDGIRARDLLSRNFRTTAPNRAWVTDFT